MTLKGFDLTAYLTLATKKWFDEAMQKVRHPEAPKAKEFLEIYPKPRNIIPKWYRELLEMAREYIKGGGILSPAPKPRKAYGWIARAAIKEALMNEAETSGLDLVNDLSSDDAIDTDEWESEGGDKD